MDAMTTSTNIRFVHELKPVTSKLTTNDTAVTPACTSTSATTATEANAARVRTTHDGGILQPHGVG